LGTVVWICSVVTVFAHTREAPEDIELAVGPKGGGVELACLMHGGDILPAIFRRIVHVDACEQVELILAIHRFDRASEPADQIDRAVATGRHRRKMTSVHWERTLVTSLGNMVM